ncbi:MAG: LPS export ABC transporter permease LptG [Pseudomonadota bacterium]|jgi:lipopolysaccharide export system permease protein|nr:LPS export ABC transporter permease LptG [Pseudomonadota bacterium]MDY6336245.1 LPS export ABC transporter permease LptG [Succinivibrionaceae bacterium]
MNSIVRQAVGILFGFTITERYIFRIVTRWFFMLTFFVIGLSYLMKCADQIHNVGEGAYTMLTMAEVCALKLPRDFVQFLPFIALTASVIGLALLQRSSELVIIQSSGLSKIRIVSATLKAMIIPVIIAGAVSELAVPVCELESDVIKYTALRQTSMTSRINRIWFHETGKILQFTVVGLNGDVYDADLLVLKGNTLESYSHAKQGHWEDGVWHMTDITKQSWGKDSFKLERLPKEDWDLVITPQKLGKLNVAPDEMSAYSLYAYISYLRENHIESAKFESEFWRKVAMPFGVIAMILLAGFAGFITARSVTLFVRLLLGIGIGMAFYLSTSLAVPMSVVYGLNPVIATLSPDLIFGCLGIWLLRRGFRS